MAAPEGLSDEEIQRFIEDGYLWLRGCFSPERAREIVEGVFGPGGSIERCTKRTHRGHEPIEHTGQSLADSREWDTNRVDVETGFSIEIGRLSPRLHRAIEQLTQPAETLRTTVGELWILNTDYSPDVPPPEKLERRRRGAYWHIDTPSTRSTLLARFDALTLLILWSDVDEHGGGTLFSPDSLDRMVEALAASDEGLDTHDVDFGVRLIERCRDLRAQTGRAGDVLITHPLMLHAPDEKHLLPVRILENPTFLARRELDLSRDNPEPSPVEECVIRRLEAAPAIAPSFAREERLRGLEDRARVRLLASAPTHFYPRTGERPTVDDPNAGAVEAADRYLFERWVAREARAIRVHHPDPAGAARASVTLLRQLVATQRDLPRMSVADSLLDPRLLAARAYAMLVLGFTNCEGINYALGRLLRAMGYEAYPYEITTGAGDDASRHMLVLLVHDGAGALVDAWSEAGVLWVDGFDIERACRNWPRKHIGPPPVVAGPFAEVPRYADVSGPTGDILHRGLYPRDSFLAGEVLRADDLDGVDPAQIVDEVESFCRTATETAPATETWRSFLALRARQVEGKLLDPASSYEELLRDRGLKGATRRLVRTLAHIAVTRSGRRRAAAAAKAPPPKTVRAPRAPVFDFDTRMRRGDVSVWPRWNQQAIDDETMKAAWAHVMEHRGEPGVPSTIRAYTHFAYCASSCNFCMYWHQVPKADAQHRQYVDYLVSLVDWFRRSFGRVSIQSAYLGGGTPTATPPEHLRRYLDAFTAAFEVTGELTVEGHPTTTDVDTVRMLADAGVNRLSMGLQSLEHDVLVRITRRNAPLDELRAVVEAARERAMVVNLDLVLGLPGQSLESFRADLRRVTELGPDFVTMYLYQPVLRLPTPPPAEMTYELALDDAVLADLAERGYGLADAIHAQQRSARLVRTAGTARPEPRDEEVYAQFDEIPSHTIAFGPGAYGHVFGRFWYREVTSMTALHERRPRYLGTVVDAVDECRSIVLDALDRGVPFQPRTIEETTGVDVHRAFQSAFSLAYRLEIFRDGHGSVEIDDREGREAVIDRIVPKAPKRKLPVIDRDGMQPELVALQRDEEETELARATLRELCEVLAIPPSGHQVVRNVWVGRRDGGAISFHVGGPKVEPLQVIVAPPGTMQRPFVSTDRFAVAYRTSSGDPPAELERRFLGWLRVRIGALQPPAVDVG